MLRLPLCCACAASHASAALALGFHAPMCCPGPIRMAYVTMGYIPWLALSHLSARVPLLLHSCLRYSLVGLRFKLGLLGARCNFALVSAESHAFYIRRGFIACYMDYLCCGLLTSTCLPHTSALASALVPPLFFGNAGVILWLLRYTLGNSVCLPQGGCLRPR